jgi:hypothetical protein
LSSSLLLSSVFLSSAKRAPLRFFLTSQGKLRSRYSSFFFRRISSSRPKRLKLGEK